MKRDLVDLHAVKPAHYAIHDRLENWARCIRDSGYRRNVLPMFRFYRPYLVGNTGGCDFVLDTKDASTIEREVCKLPEKHAHAVRWCYVFPWRDERMVCRVLVVQRAELHSLIEDGRTMLKNRLTTYADA